jgi:hypothetical protein
MEGMMTNDEMERAIEFIVKQQAQFTTDLQQLTQSQVNTDRTLGSVVNVLSQVAETQLQMAEAQARAEVRIGELAEAQKRTNESLTETNDRLNSLIVVVERYFSNGRQEN